MTDKPTSILFISDLFDTIGGAERNLLQLINNISKVKYKPILCCLKAGKLAKDVSYCGYQVINLDLNRVYSYKAIKSIFGLINFIRNEKIKLIITYHESSDILGIVLSKLSSIPVISSKRDMGYNLKFHHVLFYKIASRYYNGIITVSNILNKHINKNYFVPKYKIETIYNGVTYDNFKINFNKSDILKAISLKPDDLVVGCIAGIRKIKGIKHFIKAAAIVHNEVKEARFLIVGADAGEPGYTKSDLIELADKLGVKNEIFFLGERSDIPEILSIIDISVLSSLSEGFSNTIIESMAAGKPVVATAVGGNPEAVKHRETGFLVPAEDPETLANSLIYLLKNKAIRDNMSIAAQRRVRDFFSIERMIKKNEDFYQYIIEKHKLELKQSITYLLSNIFLVSKKIFKTFIAGLLYYSGIIEAYLFLRNISGYPIIKILAYHNVSNTFPSYLDINTDPHIFEKQVIALKKKYRIIQLKKAYELIETKTYSENCVALTFDDSYKEYFTTLFPILKKHSVPATIFISTYPIDKKVPLNVELIIFAIHNTSKKSLDLNNHDIGIFILDTFFRKETAVREINNYVIGLSLREQSLLIEEIFNKLEIDLEEIKEKNLVLNWDDIRMMHRSGVEFGAHTHTHPDLSITSNNAALTEMVLSKNRIKENIRTDPSYFAYPFGNSSNYNSKTVDLVNTAGFEGAVVLHRVKGNKNNRYLMSRKLISQSSILGPLNNFSKSLFGAEVSGITEYLFFRFLK